MPEGKEPLSLYAQHSFDIIPMHLWCDEGEHWFDGEKHKHFTSLTHIVGGQSSYKMSSQPTQSINKPIGGGVMVPSLVTYRQVAENR